MGNTHTPTIYIANTLCRRGPNTPKRLGNAENKIGKNAICFFSLELKTFLTKQQNN
jgi:hypothetical protein